MQTMAKVIIIETCSECAFYHMSSSFSKSMLCGVKRTQTIGLNARTTPDDCPLTEATATQEHDYPQYLDVKRKAMKRIAEALGPIDLSDTKRACRAAINKERRAET